MLRLRRRAHLLIAVASALVPATAELPAATQAAGTTVKRVSPVGGGFKLKDGYRVGRSVRGTECISGSSAIDAAYRCFTTQSAVLDACWPVRNSSGFLRMACVGAPWRKRVTFVSVDTFNILDGDTRASRTPWGLQLTNGRRCLRVQGSTSLVGEKAVRWSCSGGMVLLDDLDRSSSARWTVTAAVFDEASGYAVIGERRVRTAWFGKRARTP